MRRWICFALLLVLAACRARVAGPQDPASAGLSTEVYPLDAPDLHNLFRVSPLVYSGSSPDGDAGFAELQGLGVKTIISVDGGRPDEAAARRHGLRYVHLPIGYDGIPRDKILALAKVMTVLPGPFYVHCHHGKHRGPAAVAVIQLCTDPLWDVSRAEEWLKTAGTDPRYAGLTGLVRTLVRPSAEELARAPAEFPAAAPVGDLARAMVEVDTRWERLKLVKAADWSVPTGHPDIDPPHEALQLKEHLKEVARLDSVKRRDVAFVNLLGEAELAADELEKALRQKSVVSEGAGKAFARSGAACIACHERFRDHR